jgi:hypothetical protein
MLGVELRGFEGLAQSRDDAVVSCVNFVLGSMLEAYDPRAQGARWRVHRLW